MVPYYSGEDENRKKQKEELTPKKDASGSTFSEENIDHRILTKIRQRNQPIAKMPIMVKT